MRNAAFFLTILLCALPRTAAAQSDGTIGLPVNVAWDANTIPAEGYQVYVGTSPSTYDQSYDAGNATTFAFATGIAGQRYYFAVAAYAAGEWSGQSIEVSAIVGRRRDSAATPAAPAAPTTTAAASAPADRAAPRAARRHCRRRRCL